jgi:hypothetical protein
MLSSLRLLFIHKDDRPQEEIHKDSNHQIFNGDFQDKEINRLVKIIHNKVTELKDNSFIRRDIESSLMLDQIECEYLFTIYTSYMDTPPSKRGNAYTQNSPYDLTIRQINLILKGLDKIENKIAENNILNQRATEIFLKEKVIGL